MLYNSFIQSHLVYCSNVWGLGSKNSVARIFTAQKRAMRGVKQGFVNYFYKKDEKYISSNEVFIIQAKLQTSYTFKISTMVRDYEKLDSRWT